MQNSKGHISAKHEPNSLPKISLKSLFLFLSFCVEIILVSGFFVAQAHSIYHCFGSGMWARHDLEAKHSGQRLIPKPRVFLISWGWKIYSCCNSNNNTEDNNITEENMCKFLYSTEEIRSLTSHCRHLSCFRKISAVLGRLKCPEFLAMQSLNVFLAFNWEIAFSSLLPRFWANLA